jgi:hypothetical protein
MLLVFPQHLPPIPLGEGIQKKEAGILFSNGAIEIALNQSFHWLGEKVNIFCWQDKGSELESLQMWVGLR